MDHPRFDALVRRAAAPVTRRPRGLIPSRNGNTGPRQEAQEALRLPPGVRG